MTAAARREVIEAAAAELFAERGYVGASIDEIAARSGVSPPVVYDHFESKQDLYRRLVERHYAELRQVWREHFVGEDPAGRADRRAPSTPGSPTSRRTPSPGACCSATRSATRAPTPSTPRSRPQQGRDHAPLRRRAGQREARRLVTAEGLEMAWVVLRGVLQGLAMWWSEHPDGPPRAGRGDGDELALDRLRAGQRRRGLAPGRRAHRLAARCERGSRARQRS